ncbi:MAG: thioredoxin-disulfide reductase [Chloroflexi bacterium GWB2_49_20]|nr:MAG: thioredoxin-disulfide reductase [Chloroflexi bacterium GWB2_49_20]OGN78976.1 MAG: thioredoxin-disulfide reductase [Chloroflexi bacterium GWC2_49_37]OGN86263.1 MAG: thioredoxin-disulfide reductase [Chloroflexi bacterium GWD2_49_16]
MSETNKPDAEILNVLILGSGPAGLSAAIYAARAELEPLVLTGLELGGQVSLTNVIENYPGFPDGVGGSELGELMQKQAEHFGAKVEFDLAVKIDLSERPFRVQTENKEIQAKALIIATGASPIYLNIDGEKELTGKGVSYCATCDGWFFKNKSVTVVGGGDSALEEALFLTRFASNVTIVHRRDIFRASAILQKRVKENSKIKFVLNSIVTRVIGTEKVEAVLIKDVITEDETTLTTDGLFVFIGHVPNTLMLKGQLDMTELGYIKIDYLMQASIPGVFVAGEAADPDFKQVVTSAGMGAAAAIQATRFLENEKE